jgi:hypothetical protein
MAQRTPTDEVCICGHLKSRHIDGVCDVGTCPCRMYLFKRLYYGKPRPFGWDLSVEVETIHGFTLYPRHYRGCSEAEARRTALWSVKMAVRGVYINVTVKTIEPLTREQWVMAYGLGRM